MSHNPRETAYHGLLTFFRSGSRLDDTLEKIFKDSVLREREKKFAHNLIYGVVRHRLTYDWIIRSLYHGPYHKALEKFKIICCLALYELEELDFIPRHATLNEYVQLAKNKAGVAQSKIVNGILRAYLRDRSAFRADKKFKDPVARLSVGFSFPEWMIRRWLALWGESETRSLCESLNRRPVFDVRVHPHRMAVDEFRRYLETSGIDHTVSAYLPGVFKITDIQKIMRDGFFARGYCSVQDEGAVLITRMIGETDGMHILDACAAPGGKYSAIWEQQDPKTHLYGLEPVEKRMYRLRENCLRIGIPANRLVRGDLRSAPFRDRFGAILLDAPCSGLGTIAKNPDIKWRRSLEEILSFQNLQVELLSAAADLLVAQGMVIYSTCSIDPSENEEVISIFMEKHRRNFRVLPLPEGLKFFETSDSHFRTFPHRHQMDGAFAVRLQKRG